MAEITRAEKNDFLDKVKKATDDISDAMLIEEIKRMIERKPKLLEAWSRLGRNCFHDIQSVELAEFIYQRDPSIVYERGYKGCPPIHSAAYNGTIIKFIAEKEPTMLHAVSTHGRITPLLLASFRGHLDIIKWILTRDPSTANYVDSRGRTALHAVARNRSTNSVSAVECAKLLLQRVPGMRGVENNEGKTPLIIARAEDSSSKVTLFLDKLDKHDERIADAESFLSTVKVMILAMEADTQAETLDSVATNTKKTAMDALVVVAEWTKSVSLNAKSDIFKLIRS